jgi:hypothetical protein
MMDNCKKGEPKEIPVSSPALGVGFCDDAFAGVSFSFLRDRRLCGLELVLVGF